MIPKRQRCSIQNSIILLAIVTYWIISISALSINRPTASLNHGAKQQFNIFSRLEAISRSFIPHTSIKQTSSALRSASKLSNVPSLILNNASDFSVIAVLISSFLNLLGFTMASPIQPALGKHFSLPMGASFGSLSSAYPLGMMLGVFIWPTLSDIMGRKIIMTFTLFGSSMGLFLQSWAILRHWTIEHFLAARVLTGCFAGNSPITKAYLADRGTGAKATDFTKYLAWKDASSTLAFIIGPVLGGLLYQGRDSVSILDNTRRISAVIRFSAIASLIASILVAVFVKGIKTVSFQRYNDTSESHNSHKTSPNKYFGADNDDMERISSEIIACPLGTKLWTGVATVAGISALYHVADSTFFAFFPSFLQQKLALDTHSIGLAFTSFAFVSFTMSLLGSSRFIQKWGPVAACSTGLGAIATALTTFAYVASSLRLGIETTAMVMFTAAALYYCGVSLYGPSVPTMLLQCVPPHRRGFVMGFDGIVNTSARVVSPLLMGEVYRRWGAGSCFNIAGSCATVAILFVLFRRWIVLEKGSKTPLTDNIEKRIEKNT